MTQLQSVEPVEPNLTVPRYPLYGAVPTAPVQRRRTWRDLAKRAIDIVGATVLLLAAAPGMACIAALLRVQGAPVIFAQRRVGFAGKEFNCLKFRTMHPNADMILEDVLVRHPELRAEWETTWKLRYDPRVTRIGRFLRANSFDELPQFINVLRGDMSLVGPRPVTRLEIDTHYLPAGAYEAYQSVRPGITGLWQVSGRNTLSYEQRVLLDLEYVHRSPCLLTDFQILGRTIGVVLQRRGAV